MGSKGTKNMKKAYWLLVGMTSLSLFLAGVEEGYTQTNNESVSIGPEPRRIRFKAADTLHLGFNPSSLDVGDFNGDGRMDFSVARQDFPSIEHAFFHETRSYCPITNPHIQDVASYTKVAHYRGNRMYDTAIMNKERRTISFFYAAGDWLAGDESIFDIPSCTPTTMVVGHVAQDSKGDDLVVACEQRTLFFLTHPDCKTPPCRVRVIDPQIPRGEKLGFGFEPGITSLDLYSNQEEGIIFAVPDHEGVMILKMAPIPPLDPDRPDDGFKPELVVIQTIADELNQPRLVRFLDVHDRKVLVIVNQVSNEIKTLKRNDQGRFEPSQVFSVPHTEAIALGDFNADGVSDLALVNGESNSISIFVGRPNGTFDTDPQNFPVGQNPFAIVVGDFNGDRYADIAVANRDQTISVLINESARGL